MNCNHCKHFSISWDYSFPYNCSLLGIRSKKHPSLEVKLLNKTNKCNFFIEKEKSKQKNTTTITTDKELDIKID